MAQSTRNQGSNHAERIKKTMRDRENEDKSGVLQGQNYTERDVAVSLEYTDWTTVTDKARLTIECRERGMATYGRMMAFSMEVLQVSDMTFAY